MDNTVVDNKKLNKDSSKIKVEGHKGTWYVIGEELFNEKNLFLLEHETYGDEAASLIVNEDSEIMLDDVYNGFDDYREHLECCPEGDSSSSIITSLPKDEIKWKYKKLDASYEFGDTLRNLNGSDYKVLEAYDEKTLLLMDTSSNRFYVASDVATFEKYNQDNPLESMTGIEWGNSRDLGCDASKIGFEALNKKYDKSPSINHISKACATEGHKYTASNNVNLSTGVEL